MIVKNGCDRMVLTQDTHSLSLHHVRSMGGSGLAVDIKAVCFQHVMIVPEETWSSQKFTTTIHRTLQTMPKGHPARSLFSSLPLELKQTIRSQPSVDTVQIKAELLADSIQFAPLLLPTQPQTPPTTPPIPLDLTSGYTAEASSSKRRAVSSYRDSSPLLSKRRKGKGKSVVADNLHLGHPWDCTGLVKRFKDYSELPPGIGKCKSRKALCCSTLA